MADTWIILEPKDFYSSGEYYTFDSFDEAVESDKLGWMMTEDQFNRFYKNELVVGGVVDVTDDGSHSSPLSIMSHKKKLKL